jgi:Fe-S-cluster-containing dehydrogenase component
MAATKKWHLVIDVARCSNCNNCFMSDKDEFVENDWPPYSAAQPWEGQRWMNINRRERGQFPHVDAVYMPTPCMHCDDAPCIKDSPVGTVYKREDGLVIIDPVKAKAHREIVTTCPYEVIFWNEEAQLPQKCTGCAHLLDDGWKQPRCAQVCPTEALTFVQAEDAEMAAKVKAEGLEVYRPELGAAPRVYYKNLHKWTRAFIAGTVVFGDSDECARGAAVTVTGADGAVFEATTNEFGDFRIDGLEPEREYTLSVDTPGYTKVSMSVVVGAGSVSLPTLFLQKG